MKIQSRKKIIYKIFSFLFGILFLPLAIAGAVIYLDVNNFFAIQKIEIETINKSSIDSKYLNPQISKLQNNLNRFLNQSLLKLDLHEVSNSIGTLDWIISYQITRQIPDNLTIVILAREPQLLIQANGNKLFPVDSEGTVLQPVEFAHAPDTVIAVGDNFYNKVDLRKRAVELMQKLPKNGNFSRKSIAEMKYDNKDGFWMTMIRSDLKVKMGEEDLDIKSNRVSQVMDYLEQHQIKARVIDANLSKKVLVRLHKGP